MKFKLSILTIISLLFLTSINEGVTLAQESTQNPGVGTVSCPVPNGKISTHSHQVGTTLRVGGGHCTPGFYSLSCNCGTNGRRSKAIDVLTNGGDVYLPQINSQNVNWTTISDYSVAAADGGGFGYTFQTNVGSDTWYIDFLHMAGANVKIGSILPSGTSIGKVVAAHVHFTVGKNLNGTPAAGSPSDCDPNWMPSDFVCDPSLQGTTPTVTTPGAARMVKSNNLCVKVGDAPEPKPDACTEAVATGGSLPFSPVGPAPTVEAGQLVQTIRDQFGVDMQGAWNEQALRWVYEAFWKWQTTNPKFMALINGQPVILIANAAGANAFGNTVKVGQTYAEGDKFLGTLVHEFGHVIYHTKPLTSNFRIEADDAYSRPGPVTSYGDGDITENYPEILSYCLTKRPVGGLISEQRWESRYRPIAENIVGPCI